MFILKISLMSFFPNLGIREIIKSINLILKATEKKHYLNYLFTVSSSIVFSTSDRNLIIINVLFKN